MISDRIQRLRQSLDADASFITSESIHLRYLTGLNSSNALLVVTPTRAVLVTDSRYELMANNLQEDFEIFIENDLFETAATIVETEILYFESNRMTVSIYKHLEKLLPKTQLKSGTRLVEQLRMIKDDVEISTIEKAGAIATDSLAQIIEHVSIGMTERDIAQLLHRTMVENGADDLAFDTIVASGPNSAIPHHNPTDRVLRSGDFLKIDFGAKLHGYHSDCTRTFVMTRAESWQQEVYEAVKNAQQIGREALHSGAPCEAVTMAVRDSLSGSSFAQYFTHGLGHGVGLEIHEDPFLSSKDAGTLERGTIVTIEPGVYLEGRGGVRIEDTVVITQDGYRNLTNFSYDLIEIG